MEIIFGLVEISFIVAPLTLAVVVPLWLLLVAALFVAWLWRRAAHAPVSPSDSDDYAERLTLNVARVMTGLMVGVALFITVLILGSETELVGQVALVAAGYLSLAAAGASVLLTVLLGMLAFRAIAAGRAMGHRGSGAFAIASLVGGGSFALLLFIGYYANINPFA